MNNVITTFGGGELFFLVFNGIAALFKTDGAGLLMPMMRFGLMVGAVYVVTLMLFRQQLLEGVRWFLWVIVATNLLFLPKTRIHIHDPLSSYHRDVDNVPLALGVFASLVSQVGKSVTEHLEAVFTLPDYMPYHKTGTVFASSLMSQVGKFRIVDPVFKGNMERFVNQCVVYDAMIGHKYTLTDLQNTPNIWELVTTNASPVLGFLYKDGYAPGAIVTCREGARNLNALWAAEISRATALYGKRVQTRDLDEAAFTTHLLGSAQLLSGAGTWADSAQNILKQEMMIHAVEEGSNNKLSELGAASHYAATKALLQQRSAYAAAGDIAAKTLPLFKNVIEALSYALFIFIVVLALLPNGYRALLTYCGILVWTQLWAPLYAVLNLIMTLYGKSETIGHGAHHGLTLLNSSAIINANADMTTLAAWLSVSIPFISYGILKQGAAAFVGLAQHLGSAMQSAASSAAAETVSGNISLGNITMGTQAYQNTSAFQHNTSPSYTASHFKAMSTSGIEQSTFAEGTQAFTEQSMSRLSVQIMGTENTNSASQENMNKALSVAHSQSMAATQATEAAFQQSTSFFKRVGHDIFSGTDFTHTTSSSDAKTLQDFKNHVSDIRNSTGLTEAQAIEATVGASLGTGLALNKVFSANVTGTFSSSAARQQAIESAQNIATQTGYSTSLDKVVSAAKSLSEGQKDTKGAELATSALASFNQANSLREEATVAQHQVETLSQDLAFTQSQGFAVNKDLTQEVLEFVAQQPINPGPQGSSGGQIGYEGARKILEDGGDEREAYLQHFQDQHPQYSLRQIDSHKESATLTSQYEAAVSQMGADTNLRTQHSHNIQDLHQRGKAEALSLHKIPRQGVKARVENQHKQAAEKINQRQQVLTHKEGGLQQAEKNSQSKNMTASVIKNAAKNVWKGGEDIVEALPQGPIPPFIP